MMHIKQLELENFRGAQNLKLELHGRLNLFVGLNGAGKSTVLDAAAILLSWLANRIKSASASGRPIDDADIKNGYSIAKLRAQIAIQGEAISWQIARTRKGHSKSNGQSLLKEVSQLAQMIQRGITEGNGQANIPLFAYYPVGRAVLDIPLRIREKHQFDLLSAYESSLTSGANFRTFFEWFREREDLENEARRDSETLFHRTQATKLPDTQLEAVRKSLEIMMPEFKNLRVRRDPLRMEVEKHGKPLAVSQLSDGEKCLMAMVGDMARRMAIANPLLDNPLAGEGIFLIDEIDLHLHPAWQRMVVPGLMKVFPNCQFLISTHSPHVITHVEPESLFMFTMTKDGLQCSPASESYGKTVERVLEDLMGLQTTRPDAVQQAIDTIYTMIDAGKLVNSQSAINDLRERIGSDPELVRAEVLIRRKELIGK